MMRDLAATSAEERRVGQGVTPAAAASAERRVSPALNRAWWIPLAFVVAALLLLLLTPVFVNARVSHLRHDLSDRSDEARVRINDLEAAIATELYARVAARQGSGVRVDSIVAAAGAREREDEARLDTLVRQIDPEAVARFVELRSVVRAWRTDYAPVGGGAAAGLPAADRPDVLGAAERLDDHLEQRSAEIRERIRRLEAFSVWSAVVLVPIALASVIVIFWAGGRVLTFAHESERDRAALARSTEARAALLRGVTHDVKNPMGAAAGYAELLEDGIAGPLTPEQIDMVRRIRRLVDVALETIGELLELARAEAPGLQIELRDVDLNALVRDVAVDYAGAAREKALAVSVAPADGQLQVRTDPARVRRIVANLLSNAIKYTPAQGTVTVRVRVEAPDDGPRRRVGIEVRDSGPGIPPALRERIFEDFFRLPSAERMASGSGIGLTISRQLARLLGGDIAVDDAPEGGSRFTLWLPG